MVQKAENLRTGPVGVEGQAEPTLGHLLLIAEIVEPWRTVERAQVRTGEADKTIVWELDRSVRSANDTEFLIVEIQACSANKIVKQRAGGDLGAASIAVCSAERSGVVLVQVLREWSGPVLVVVQNDVR